MITETDALNCIEFDNYFVILPSYPLWDVHKFMKTYNGTPCKAGFRYNSGENSEWLSVEQIRELIRLHVDPGFVVQK
jgi:hypothetical protein